MAKTTAQHSEESRWRAARQDSGEWRAKIAEKEAERTQRRAEHARLLHAGESVDTAELANLDRLIESMNDACELKVDAERKARAEYDLSERRRATEEVALVEHKADALAFRIGQAWSQEMMPLLGDIAPLLAEYDRVRAQRGDKRRNGNALVDRMAKHTPALRELLATSRKA